VTLLNPRNESGSGVFRLNAGSWAAPIAVNVLDQPLEDAEISISADPQGHRIAIPGRRSVRLRFFSVSSSHGSTH
jgi:hypothetical protein